jgi:hypothetical protein
MTINTFKSNVGSYRKQEILRGALFLALMVAAAAPTTFAEQHMESMGFHTASIIVVSASFAIIAVLMFYVLSPMRTRCLRKLQANCSACGILLLSKHSDSVIATGRCPVCGNQVLQ